VHFFVGLPHVRFDENSNDMCESGVFVETGEGVKIATVGDWVVANDRGHMDVLTDDQFRALYTPHRHSRWGKRWVVSALALLPGGRVVDRVEMSRHRTAGSARRSVQKYKTFHDPNDKVQIVYQINHVDEVLL
jgi:hypothetical protein